MRRQLNDEKKRKKQIKKKVTKPNEPQNDEKTENFDMAKFMKNRGRKHNRIWKKEAVK